MYSLDCLHLVAGIRQADAAVSKRGLIMEPLLSRGLPVYCIDEAGRKWGQPCGLEYCDPYGISFVCSEPASNGGRIWQRAGTHAHRPAISSSPRRPTTWGTGKNQQRDRNVRNS